MSRHLSTRKILSKSIHAFLSNPANIQTDRQTNKETRAKRVLPPFSEVNKHSQSVVFTDLRWTALRAATCDWTVLDIECYDGDIIRVISANYGRWDTAACPGNAGECTYSDTLQFVLDR